MAAALLAVLAAGEAQARSMEAAWSAVAANTGKAAGIAPKEGLLKSFGGAQAGGVPAIRYSHASVALPDGAFVITHGYYYDADAGKPAWLSDTWSYAPQGTRAARKRAKGWTRLHPGNGGGGGAPPSPAPPARYGHVAAAADGGDIILLHGGTDGGHRLGAVGPAGVGGFQPNYEFDDLWTFDVNKRTWREVARQGLWPIKRYLHTLVPASLDGTAFWMYGGLGIAADDTLWRLLADDGGAWRWERPDAPREGPGQRYGHGAVSDGAGGMFLFGGRAGGISTGAKVTNELWRLDGVRMTWRLLGPPATGTDAGNVWPGKLIYPAAAVLAMPGSAAPALLVQGGSSEVPRVSCQNDTWLWHPRAPGADVGRWMRLPASPLPTYHHTLATAWLTQGGAAARPGEDAPPPLGAAAFSFGGHACVGHVAPRGLYYYNAVWKLDLGPMHGAAHASEHDDAGL